MQFTQDHGRNFRQRVQLVAHFHADVVVRAFYNLEWECVHAFLNFGIVNAAPDQTLCRVHRVCGIRDGLALCKLTD